MEDGKLDVKIAFLGNPFEVYTYPLLHVNPDILVPEASEGKNITYHHGGGGKDVVIHLKNDLAGRANLDTRTCRSTASFRRARIRSCLFPC